MTAIEPEANSSALRPARGHLYALLCALAFAAGGCEADSGTAPASGAAKAGSPALAATATPPRPMGEQESPSGERLTRVLAAQEDPVKARYGARHPKETLGFFGIEPGMTVVEALPEGGWYSKILHPYLGESGRLIGADYALSMYPLFDYYSDEELADKARWSERWPLEVAAWGDGADAAAFNFGSLPESLRGQADAVLFVRALHNLALFEASGGYLSAALADAFAVLKPGGTVGVVQHMGPETNSDAWASGDNGYLKKSAVIRLFEEAGFVLQGESAINENPLDQPSETEQVWRLAPTLEAPGDAALAAAYAAIGESNRMTLRFAKPGS